MVKATFASLLQRCRWSWQGWRAAWASEASLRGWATMCVLSSVAALVLPLTGGERALILAGGVLVLVVELLNTAVERVVDYISLDQHPLAGEAKDIASCAVSLTGIAVGVAWVAILWGWL